MFAANTFKHGRLSLVTFFLLFAACFYYSYLFARHGDALPPAAATFVERGGHTIETSGCRIPAMPVNGPGRIDEYAGARGELRCDWTDRAPPSLVTSNLTGLTLNASALAALNVVVADNDPNFECHYTPLLRDPDDHNNVKFGVATRFETGGVTVPDEMVEVVCTVNGSAVHRDYAAFVRPTPAAMEHRDGNLSVLVLGLDSVSRVNFHRQMPRTSAFLRERLAAAEMLGYNKVEDNTFPNLVPVLSGLSVDELRAVCWPSDGDTFDRCRFVWSEFKARHFDTFFVEDCPLIGAFDYLKRGFRERPTDHGLRPLMLRADRLAGNTYCGNTNCCVGPRLWLQAVLDYAIRAAASMAGRLYWSFVWSTSLTHDFVEYPAHGDSALRDFFERFHGTGEMNRTAVVLMSDHGMRWGPFRKTYQGSLEDRLPLLTFIVPAWFRHRYPVAWANLQTNARRLTTPYDLHETLLEFVDLAGLDDASVTKRARDMLRDDAEIGRRRGVSLFLEVPEDRTCTSAGIPIHYCACQGVTQPVDVNDAQVIAAAECFVGHVNGQLSGYPQCANLTLSAVAEASVEGRRDGEKMVKDFRIQVITDPGRGHFEATVRQDVDDLRFRLTGSVSRLNLYGDQSRCVTDAKIKLLCYCKN